MLGDLARYAHDHGRAQHHYEVCDNTVAEK